MSSGSPSPIFSCSGVGLFACLTSFLLSFPPSRTNLLVAAPSFPDAAAAPQAVAARPRRILITTMRSL